MPAGIRSALETQMRSTVCSLLGAMRFAMKRVAPRRIYEFIAWRRAILRWICDEAWRPEGHMVYMLPGCTERPILRPLRRPQSAGDAFEPSQRARQAWRPANAI